MQISIFVTYSLMIRYTTVLVVNYGISNTIVLELPYFTTKPAITVVFENHKIKDALLHKLFLLEEIQSCTGL